MNYAEFLNFVLNNTFNLACWILFFYVFLYLIYNRLLVAKSLDAFHLIMTFNFGTTYGVVFSMFQNHAIGFDKFKLIVFYALFFHIPFYVLSKLKPIRGSFPNVLDNFVLNMKEEIFSKLMLTIFTIGAIVVIYKSGFLVFTSSNRFEAARGIGGFVRYTYAISLLLVAYYTNVLLANYKYKNMSFFYKKTYVKISIIIFIIIVSSLINGAKSALLWYVITVVLTVYINRPETKIPLKYFAFIGIVTLSFALVVLNLNMTNNNQNSAVFGADRSPIFDRFIVRVLANADQSYHSLPYDIIDKIQTDNLWVRIYSNIVSNSLASKIEGYDVSNFNVGRAILLVLSPHTIEAGGPVSHYDLFFYKYCGNWGYILTIFIAIYLVWVLKKLKKIQKEQSKKNVLNSFYIVLWIQSVQLVMEPSIIFSYIIDLILLMIIFKFASVLVFNLLKVDKK